MKDIYVEQINLQNYRNFLELFLKFENGVNLIVGNNGIGKTNILEAISLLSPGKGLKSVHFNDICKVGNNSWLTKFNLQSKVGKTEIISSFSSLDRSRKIQYNGSQISSSELPNLLNVVWTTPQMESLFLDGASARRRYLDRVVYNFDNNHAKHLAKYEHFVRERKKILAQVNFASEGDWLGNLEEKIAIEANLIYKARQNAINLMQNAINSLDSKFPKANLKLGSLSEDIEKCENFVEEYSLILKKNRQKDSYSKRTNFGVHKTDLLVFHSDKDRSASQCSTGEQKALLISLIIASIEFILHNTKTKPILLLDELFVHLDDTRKKYLSDYIIATKLQTFITTTDIIGIEELAQNANIINL